jgi:hypothetical protein
MARASTPGGFTEAILGAIRRGMDLPDALRLGMERSRSLSES